MKKIFNIFISCAIFFIINPPKALALQPGFVYLKDIDPTIIENLRYFSNENFVGRKIDGYLSNRIILTKEAAEALSKVQKELINEGYSLVVYDAYRPQQAVNHFMTWSKDISDQVARERYYPDINKADIFKLNYVAEKSGHSRGSTVDISIIKLGEKVKPIKVKKRKLKNYKDIPFLDDGTVDMGASFDLFDEVSHHNNKFVEEKFIKLRNYLRNLMKQNGFNDYKKEWWHYTLKDEPFPDTYFNFVIE